LKSEDADTIDLVGMLFDQIAQNAPAKGNTQSMLTQLRVPLMRVALSDKDFFAQRSHPARELLNAVTEVGIHWIDDAESDPIPALLHKLHTVVERLNNEFDGDLSLIEHMLGDLSQHMHKLARTAAVAERRLVDASKGREKLALARETAANAIATRIAAAHPKRLLRTLLERAWTDVLALTLMSRAKKARLTASSWPSPTSSLQRAPSVQATSRLPPRCDGKSKRDSARSAITRTKSIRWSSGC
jgi:hypothetical protein